MKKRDLYFALHVERVGIALAPGNESNDSSPSHQQKAVARVTLTNFESEIVLDTFVVIPVPVTDFFETGIRPEHVQANASPPATPTSGATDAATVTAADTQEASRSFSAVRARVERMLRGKILIGYDLEEGLKSLGLSHPTTDMRECSSYFPTLSSSSLEALEELSRAELNRWSVKASKARVAKDIPSNEAVVFANNDPSISRKPVLVCVTTMDLYKKHRNEWETALIARGRERERQQQEHLLKVSQQRKLEQHQTQHQLPRFGEGSSLLSIHCESVRTGISGVNKTLARVTIVDGRSRNILMDDFCQIPLPVTDFCDTGITPFDIQVPSPMSASSAKPLSVIRAHVEQFLRGSLLVGYKVEEDLKALGISHPWTQIRDTAFFPPFLHTRTVGGSTSVVTVRSPDELSAEFLGQPLRPMGDRARPVDLCQSTLGLYDTFRVQWERQNQDAYLHHQHPHQPSPQHLRNDPSSRHMMPPPPSPSGSSTGMLHSPHRGHHDYSNKFYRQQQGTNPYGDPTIIPSPAHRYHPKHPQHVMPEQQQQRGVQSRSKSSSWLAWGKQQLEQQNHAAATSQMLSPQAFQALQEDSSAPHAPSNYAFQDQFSVSSYFGDSTLVEGNSRYEAGSEGSAAMNSEAYATESVISSLPDETSSVMSSDRVPANFDSNYGLPSPIKNNNSATSSSWFLFGSKKSKYPPSSDAKSACDTMASVHEMEVLNDDGILPPPTNLFSRDVEESTANYVQKSVSSEDKKSESASSDSSTMSPSLTSRKWFGFRKSSPSPVPKVARAHTPSSLPSEESTFEDLSISAQPEGLPDTEASIEITLSIPNPVEESVDSGFPSAEKSAMTSLTSRPSSSSWFGFRRSSKSSGSKNSNVNQSHSDLLTKGVTQTEIPDHPDLLPAPTERTTAMDDDWLQEVMSQSTGTTQDIDPWLRETGQVTESDETKSKSSVTSRGQASWFGFKRPKASKFISGLTSTEETEDLYENFGWKDHSVDSSWMSPSAANAPGSTNQDCSTIVINTSNDVDASEDIFRPRARLPTESTLPSVTTEEHLPSEEEESFDSDEAKDFDYGAAQSFNFLKI